MKHCCFNITSNCNMDCSFCYRVGSSLGNVSVEKAFSYIDYLVSHGCSIINITGGEPLLHPFWREIIHYCKSKDLRVFLSTNGLLLDINDSVLQDISLLCIPLDDSLSGNDQQMMRSSNQVRKALMIIEEYLKGDFDFRLRINTVVTRQNVAHLDEIFAIVNHPEIEWKLFELREKGAFNKCQGVDPLPLKELTDIIAKYIEQNKECNIYYSGNPVENHIVERHPDPFVLNYNGDLYLTKQSEDIFVKNIDIDSY